LIDLLDAAAGFLPFALNAAQDCDLAPLTAYDVRRPTFCGVRLLQTTVE